MLKGGIVNLLGISEELNSAYRATLIWQINVNFN